MTNDQLTKAFTDTLSSFVPCIKGKRLEAMPDVIYDHIEHLSSSIEGLYQEGKITWDEYKGIVK